MRYRLIVIMVFLSALAARADVPDLVERTRPYDVPERPRALHPDIPDLLRAALGRPDAETRLEALADVRRHRLESLEEPVAALLSDDRPIVVAAAIEALHTLDARGRARRLMGLLAEVEPRKPVERGLVRALDRTLADWAFAQAIDGWVRRAGDGEAKLAMRVSACEAIGRLAERTAGGQPPGLASAGEALVSIVGDRDAAASLRLAAAKARGWIEHQPPLDAARALLNERIVDRLCALHMVWSAPSAGAGELCRRAALDRSSAVQRVALDRLVAWGRGEELPLDLLSRAADSIDPMVRKAVAEGVALHVDEAAVALAMRLIGDAHPDVRERARRSLETIAGADGGASLVRTAVDRAAPAIAHAIADDAAARWREAEQLARLAGAIDHKPAAEHLLGFFAAERPVVATAAWDALRRLDVPATREPAVARLQSLLDRLERRAEGMTDAELASSAESERSEGLWRRIRAATLTMGDWRERRADSALRSVIPKNHPLPNTIRAAGVWALGMIHDRMPDSDLAAKLAGRLNDHRGMEPEAFVVRIESAVAIGRMAARSQLDSLQRFDSEQSPVDIRAACRWAVGRITGEPQPTFDLPPRHIRDTFIVPTD